MEDLVILGTGVHAAEMAEIVQRINAVSKKWNLLGYVSRLPDDVGTLLHGLPVIGSAEDHRKFADAKVAADNKWITAGIPELWGDPRRAATLIDPSAFVSASAYIGPGCVLYPHCFVGLEARLQSHVFCLSGCTFNHHVSIESRVIAASGVTVAGRVTIEEDCYLGQSCSIKQNLTIGRNSLIGMGSVVLKDVPANSVMAGCPARFLRERV